MRVPIGRRPIILYGGVVSVIASAANNIGHHAIHYKLTAECNTSSMEI